MIASSGVPEANGFITVREGFEAIGTFLEMTWQRRGMPAEEIAFIRGGAGWADGAPVDPAMWQDWLTAVDMNRRDAAEGGTVGEASLS
jgi:hypothetical protein